MRNYLILVFLLLNYVLSAQVTPYEKAWKALNENNRAGAEQLLLEARNNPATFQDAYISDLYLKNYNGKEKQVTDFTESFYKKVENPYPYLFALWFNPALLGPSGKKTYDHQIKLIDQLIADEKAPGTIVASANYQKGLHSLFSNDFGKMQRYFDAIGNIQNWQYVGPFENLSESGFFKNYGPLEHPEPNATFRSITNAEIKWATPAAENKDGWIPVSFQFNRRTAIVYAQSFVTSPIDQVAYCNIGVSGSIKVWINDELVIAESRERVTDLDTYTIKCDLKKGANRVLIQIGFTHSSYPNFTLRFTDEKFKQIQNIAGSSTYTSYPKIATDKRYTLLPHFAEAFFIDKITKQPNNLVNYLLLADVYLRSKKIIEARNLLDDAIAKAPDNCLLKMKLAEVLIKEDNRTLLLEEIEKIKQSDPESLLVLDLNIKELFSNQKYEDGAKELEKRIKLHGEDESTATYKLLLLINDKKYEELVKEVEKMFVKYPANEKILELMYSIKKEVYKDKKRRYESV
jgi:tetratricopeptide (TPR) repeat protein